MQLDGLIHVVGEHDTGKTRFAFECGADPKNICFFDDDIKGRLTVRGLLSSGILKDEKNYFDLAALAKGKREVEFHDAVLKIIDGIKYDQYEAIVFDTWTRFGATCAAKVKNKPDAYRQFWAHDGRIKGAEWIQEGQLLEAAVLGQLMSLTKTVVVVTHVKDYYYNNVKVDGKFVAAASRTISRVPNFRVWLRRNPNGRPVPVGLPLKRPCKDVMTENGLRTINILPLKMTPLDTEHSLWDTFWRYWDDPVGDRPLTADETPNEVEMSILDGTLTADQKRTFNMIVEKGLVEKEDVEPVITQGQPPMMIGVPDWTEDIRKALDEGKSVTEVAQALADKNVSLADVLKVKATMQEMK